MNKFRLKILESDRKFYDGECESVTFSISDGEYGILAGHSNMIAAVETGELRFTDGEGKKTLLSVSTGIVKVENGDVLILVDSLELPEDGVWSMTRLPVPLVLLLRPRALSVAWAFSTVSPTTRGMVVPAVPVEVPAF